LEEEEEEEDDDDDDDDDKVEEGGCNNNLNSLFTLLNFDFPFPVEEGREGREEGVSET
jgi:hypothetical protein